MKSDAKQIFIRYKVKGTKVDDALDTTDDNYIIVGIHIGDL